MYPIIRDFLFRFDAERIHHLAEFFLSKVANKPFIQDVMLSNFFSYDPRLENEVLGLKFPNPVGLGAGFDKNGVMVEGLGLLGFGYLELGTVTKNPQSGNIKPRLWRHIDEQSLQNAMGFNNNGSRVIAKNIAKIYPFSIPIGINLGKNKDAKDALDSYSEVLKDFLDLGDYYVFNLSSPNTPNLRDLQNVDFVNELFCMAREFTKKPILLKISPDMEVDSMLKTCEMAIKKGASGIIATNTTIDYALLKAPKDRGGISGRALREKSKEVFKILAQSFFKKTVLVSVGGIDSVDEAYERIRLGASLIQVFSHFIYHGPSLSKDLNAGLLERLRRDGFDHISQAVGVDL